MSRDVFPFAFEPSYGRIALLFGVTPASAEVALDESTLEAKFGPWRVRTTIANIRDVKVTGPYHFLKTAGPARMSFADHGLTFATNGRCGVLVTFFVPVTGGEPTRTVRHPNLTVTVADCSMFSQRLSATISARQG